MVWGWPYAPECESEYVSGYEWLYGYAYVWLCGCGYEWPSA